ncbi:MAG: hypothetical protein Q3979_02395 [Actinomycetaceae bacterium]|nr:hypothetical protein [Actinomycetaceae bacterium]
MNAYARTATLLAGTALLIGLTALAVVAMSGDQSSALPTLTTIPGAALLIGAGLALSNMRGEGETRPASTGGTGREPNGDGGRPANAAKRPNAAKPLAPRLRSLALVSGAATLVAAPLLASGEPVLRVVLMTGLALQGSLCLWWAGRAHL